MSDMLLPTTRAQVSGHKFLQRRVEHALVFGDLRMIHDPLARRRRALLFGITALVLLGLGAGLLAFIRPAADPGEAPILRADSGALFVRVEDTLHPVGNLASARLIAGEAAQPARIADDILLSQPLGTPLGIPGAPGVLPAEPAPDLTWSVCHDSGADQVTVVVREDGAPAPLAPGQAVLAESGGREHLVTAAGRRLLPVTDSPEGRVVRRRLGIDSGTPVWEPLPEVLRVIAELPAVTVPPGTPPVLQSAGGNWLEQETGLTPVTPLQREILADLGSPVQEVPRTELALRADDPDPAPLHLPEAEPEWLDPGEQVLCVSGEAGTPGILPADPGGVALPGDSMATTYAGPGLGSLVVDTGAGYRVVSETGTVHVVPGPEQLAVLGLPTEPSPVPWQLLRLLPLGPELSPGQAVQAAGHEAG